MKINNVSSRWMPTRDMRATMPLLEALRKLGIIVGAIAHTTASLDSSLHHHQITIYVEIKREA